MSKYDEMSDAQIDYLVKGIKYGHNDKDINRLFHGGRMSFCNNPNGAWPIMLECGISIINLKDSTAWFACSEVEFETVCMSPDGNDSGVSCMTARNESYHTNPLRAAMIVFLMMKEAKQCS